MGVSRTSVELAHSPERIDESLVRNVDVVSRAEQRALAHARMLVAGCGSVGGSVVEPLTRLGIGALVIADPERFDLSNVNRQLCLLHEVGQSKAEVAAARARAINPCLDTRVFDEGLTLENLEAAFEGVNLVFDAVDAATSPWIKYRLHEMACARRIPVMAGFDFGGKAVLYVFDYRRGRAQPFHGRTSAQAHRVGDLARCLTWLGYRHYPADFLPIIRDRMGSRKPWPQVSYCVQALGALGTRCTLDLLMHRKVPHVVAFDVHMAMRPMLQRLREYARQPMRLLLAFIASRRRRPATAVPDAPSSALSATLEADHALRRVLEAMVSAPSPHNCQPWEFRLLGDRRIEIGWNAARGLPVVDPRGDAIALALGCAIEAAHRVADVQFEASGREDFHHPDWHAGVLHVRGLRASDYARAFGLLAQRATHRGAYREVPLSAGLAERCAEVAAPLGAHARVRVLDPVQVRALGLSGARRLFRDRAYLRELLAFMRLSDREARANPTGFTRAGILLDRPSALFLRLLRQSPTLASLAQRCGLAELMSRNAVASIRDSGAFVLVTHSGTGVTRRIAAGRALMRVWLELVDEHLHCQPIDFPIGYEPGREAMYAQFGAARDEQAVMLLRIGKAADPAAPSPRLPLHAVCVSRVDSARAIPMPAGRATEVAS